MKGIPIEILAGGGAPTSHVRSTYRRVLNESLTSRETSILSSLGGVRIVVTPLDGGMAAYVGPVDGIHTIVVDPQYCTDPSTLLHETVHILQEVDPERPWLDSTMRSDDRVGPRRVWFKEALTEAEVLARSPRTPSNPGYYLCLDDASAMEHDRSILRRNRDVRHGRYAHGVYRTFGRLRIRRLGK